jgi:hypothetical protein
MDNGIKQPEYTSAAGRGRREIKRLVFHRPQNYWYNKSVCLSADKNGVFGAGL